ncbi:MAG: CbiQ family ECF transporter T component [Candidatus Hydrothermales bacterium]
MKHKFIDQFAYEKGFLQNLPARIKLLVLIFLLSILIAFPPNLYFYLVIFLILLTFLFISKVPPLYLLKRVMLITPFLMVIFFLSLLSNKSLTQFFFAIVRSILSVFSIIFFLSVTKIEEFIKLLERAPHGKLISLILSFLYRYFFILEDEFLRMKRSMVSKGKRPDFKSYLILSGFLFLRSYERSEKVLKAMISRGWSIEKLR